MRRLALAASLALAGSLGAAPPAGAQERPATPAPQDAWNAPRALDLVERARARRREPIADSMLLSYRAEASGHIYFLLDREEAGEPVLLRADQVALELYWARPGLTKQVIHGMRSEEQLPIKDFAYYLDRYTVIQNGFDDEIRVGEGRDIRDVPHPLAPGADRLYDYRLADSTTIRLPGRADPLRVYEIQVRPEDFDEAAIVGSLFIERARADLVRLAFTFTPAAYIDPRNERVEVALENALWEGRYWLPREQRLLVRREIPELDLDVGTVIRAVLRVSDYELNIRLPPAFFSGPGVVFAQGPRGLEEYDFDEGLFEGLDDVGLAPGTEPGTLDEVDVGAITGRILRQRYLRGVPRMRLYAPDASSILRYDRAEGVVTGAGLSFGAGEYQVDLYGAWQWRAERPIASIGFRPLPASGLPFSFEAYYRRPLDLGLRQAAAGVISSIAAAAFGEDYRDLYFASGGAVSFEAGPWWGYDRVTLHASLEWHRSADPAAAATTSPLDEDRALRPVVPVDEGRQALAGATFWLEGELPGGAPATTAIRMDFGFFDGDPFAIPRIDIEAAWRARDLRSGLDAAATVFQSSDSRTQHVRLLGGRGTLPGHPFRAYAADFAADLRVEAWKSVVRRWLRVRAIGVGAAWHSLGTDGDALDYGASLGVGVGLIDGILRLDWAVPFGQDADGFDDGVFILSVDPRLWPFM